MRRLLVGFLAVIMAVSVVHAEETDMLAAAFKASYTAESAGNLNEAYRQISNAAGVEKNYAGVMRLAYLKGRLGLYEEAAGQYIAAARLAPGAIEPILCQQYQYLMLKDWARLESAAKAGLALDARNYWSQTRLAYASYMQQKYKDAVEQYGRVATLYPLDLDVALMLGWSNALAGNDSAALKCFRQMLLISPDNKSAREGVAYVEKRSR